MVETIEEVENDSPSPKKPICFFQPELEIKLAPITTDPIEEIKQRVDRIEDRLDEFSQNPLDSKLGMMQKVQTCTARKNSSLLDSSHLEMFNQKLNKLELQIHPKITIHSSMASDWQVALEHSSKKIYQQMLRKYVLNWPNQGQIISYKHHQ